MTKPAKARVRLSFERAATSYDSAADVQRLALIKQLSDLGHAIGALARLDMAALQAVQATHAQTVGGRHVAEAAAGWRLAVIGDALHRRLQRDPCWPLGRPRPTLTGPWPDLATAAQAAEPHALVSPAPRSQVRRRTWAASITCASEMLARSGKIG